MANIIYSKIFQQILNGGVNMDTATIRAMLERNTSAYTPNKDHAFVSDLSGIVYISVASYAIQTAPNPTITIDNANDRVEFTFDPIAFGSLESGQTVRALILYVQTGGSDATPTDDPLICYIDTATGLTGGAVLGGGPFTITPNAEGVIQFAQG